MAQDSPRRRGRLPFFNKIRSQAHLSSDPPPPGQSRLASLHSKAKDIFTRHPGRPNPSQRNSPSTGAIQPKQDSPQLTVPEEGADQLPNTTSGHPSVSPPYDGNHDVSTSDQQSGKLPETDRSTHESQTAQGAKLNDSATAATSKPDSKEVDAARLLASQGVSGLEDVSGAVKTVASGINNAADAGDTVTAVDNVASLLSALEKFNSIVDKIAEIHPYAKAAWSV
ncbi:hypothetical protein DFH29DRAFT_1070912, partial [Suillus ampliporus]